MPISWDNLRHWNGSQNRAFELLCGQLVLCESLPFGSLFIPMGSPDAGVECYWQLPSGDEWAWQAKFFTSAPAEPQWWQMDDSVRKALDLHPRLTSYTFCLPIDRADPRMEEQNWHMDKWNERVGKWQQWSADREMVVEFLYWGEAEILKRLSRTENEGRYFFWFDEVSFGEAWFVQRVEDAVANVGPRYTPELHVGLPVSQLFQALARTREFWTNRIESTYGRLRTRWRSSNTENPMRISGENFRSLGRTMDELLSALDDHRELEMSPLPLVSFAELSNQAERLARQVSLALREEGEREKRKAPQVNWGGGEIMPTGFEKYSSERHSLEQLAGTLEGFTNFIQSEEAKVTNVPALLITGEGGAGKTHLLCDAARQRVEESLPTLLLLGQHFTKEEPWTQIIHQLGLYCSKEQLLGALEASAQAQGSRALILIDALNEGEGILLWQNHLSGLLNTLARYPWVGLAVSVRSSYERIVIPEGLVPERLVRHEHRGFSGFEYEAARKYFEHFHIQQPTVPMLVPEFSNPQFLKYSAPGYGIVA